MATVFDEVASDWLTLTSRNLRLMRVVSRDFEPERTGEFARRGRYTGAIAGKVFLGDRETEVEGGKIIDYKLTASGSDSMAILARCAELSDGELRELKCTRIDIQVSVPSNVELPWFRAAEDYLKAATWGRGGKRPNVQLRSGDESDEGLGQTLYIGSRKTKNRQMMRIYTKLNGDVRYLRAEVEYSKKLADSAFIKIVRGSDMAGLITSYIDSFPKEFKQIMRDIFGAHMASPVKVRPLTQEERDGIFLSVEEVAERERLKRWRWFKYTVAPSLLRQYDSRVLSMTLFEVIKLAMALKSRIKRTIEESMEATITSDLAAEDYHRMRLREMGEFSPKKIIVNPDEDLYAWAESQLFSELESGKVDDELLHMAMSYAKALLFE